METIFEHVVDRPPVKTLEPRIKSIRHHSPWTEKCYEVSKFGQRGMTRERYKLEWSSDKIS
jgi:hypothetical protein